MNGWNLPPPSIIPSPMDKESIVPWKTLELLGHLIVYVADVVGRGMDRDVAFSGSLLI